ncbi:MAG: GHKL domain-containing protein [Bacteroidetes bacterium]|nr:GHKL domain-containing protein [Bacteroidota bacterium]
MKKLINNPVLYLCLSIAFVIIILVKDYNSNRNNLKKENIKLGKILQKHIVKKIDKASKILNNKDLYQTVIDKNYKSQILKKLEKENFYLISTKNDSLYFWNSIQPISDSAIVLNQDSVFIIDAGKITFLVKRKKLNEYNCFLIYKIADNSEISNLPNDHPFEGLSYKYRIKLTDDKGYNITSVSGQSIGYFFLKEIDDINPFSFWCSIIAFFFFGLSIFKYIENNINSGFGFSNFAIVSFFCITFRVLLYHRIILKSLQNSEIFNPEIFASSFLIPSLGDLLLNVICFLTIFISFINIENKNFLNFKYQKLKIVKTLLLFISMIFLSDMVISLVRSLVSDSNISFDFSDLTKINIYSFIAITLIGLMMGSIMFIITFFVKHTGFNLFLLKEKMIVIAVSCIIYSFFQTYDGHLPAIIISINILYFLLILLWNTTNFNIKEFYLNILILLVVSGFSAYIIYYQNKKHEEQYLNVFVDKIVSEQDIEAEEKFLMIENKLISEFITPQDFKDFIKQKDEYEKRIKNLFFSGYLDKFDLKILSFDSSHKSLNIDNRYTFKILDEIYLFKSVPTISTHFYKIKNKTGIRGYIAKFETCNLEGSFGSVFLVLQPKIIQSSHSYPDIFSDKKRQTVFEFKDYSYAIYQNHKLVSQKGDFPYSLTYENLYFTKNKNFSTAEYKHFIFNLHQDIELIISKRKDYMVKSFAMFSFMFIYFTILGLTFSALWAGIYIIRYGLKSFLGKNRKHTPFLDYLSRTFPLINNKQKLLSTRIQVSMVGLVFFGLVVSVFFTIQYVNYNYNQRQHDQLFLKLKEILNQLDNEPDLSKKLANSVRLKALVNQLGDANRLDLNIFDKSGILLASTQPDIYSQHLLAPLMHPEALYKMRNEKISQLLQKENISNFDYLSGYVPLLGDEHEIRAFLNLPYFTEKSEIDKEISSFLVSLINIYFLLLLIAIVVAYFIGQRISLPLQIIRNKLSQTSISTKNEIIEWKRDDEIGQLVKQYNKMVLELEESANKLSESEREGAWREMAKQIAHEIKNPLTPMKLNIQYLQRAWDSKQNIDATTFKRITNILIEQIESLSHLATEFSSFAKMPTDKYTNCRVDEILLSTIHLFEQSENIDFVYEKNLTPSVIYADPEQISRVFTNIIKNAIQSIQSETDGKIEISFTNKHGEVIIAVKDNGEGIDDEVKSKIFVPSFSTKNSGMGLGLAISKKIIEKCNGKIWFTSTKNNGSVFYILFKTV